MHAWFDIALINTICFSRCESCEKENEKEKMNGVDAWTDHELLIRVN